MALDQTRQEIPAAPDYDEIVEFIQSGYIDALNQHDFSKLRRFFHKNAAFAFVEEDGTTLEEGRFDDDMVRDWTTPGRPTSWDMPTDWEWRVVSLTQAGDLASVMLEMHSQSDPVGSRWVDLHALLRIDGQWHDMNKTAAPAILADWAGK